MSPERLPSATAKLNRSPARPEPRIAEIATWLGQFSRTLKTCRLYEGANPNTVRFREELAGNLAALLERHGTFRLEFSAQQVLCEEHVVMGATSREDNFAMPFFRDGLYALTFVPGIESSEVQRLVDILLRVTSRVSRVTEDLVTLLWDADLSHLGVSYVSAETDVDLGDAGDAHEAPAPQGRLMPWPARVPDGSGGLGAPEAAGAKGAEGASAGAVAPAQANDFCPAPRAEDWRAWEPAADVELAFAALDETSAVDVDAFVTRMHAERAEPIPIAAMALVRDALGADPAHEDRDDLVEVLERILREAISTANWSDARAAVACLSECTAGYWDGTLLMSELAQPDSTVTAALAKQLDELTIAETNEFAAFAVSLGASSIEWLMAIVAQAGQQRTRRVLLRTLVDMCEGNPERLAPWLSDPRWFVVRNAVHVIGASGGRVPVGMFAPLLTHPEVRVRHEVVTALANCAPDDGQPLLLQLMRDPEASVRGPALYRLGARRNDEVSRALLELVADPAFRKRPEDEFRSVFSALGGCSSNRALPSLEALLYESGGARGASSAYLQAIARAIARIGTLEAREALECGTRSRHAAARDACRTVLKGTGHA